MSDNLRYLSLSQKVGRCRTGAGTTFTMCDIAARAGGMDFQKVQEQWKWQAMIRKERKIELNNFKNHMARFAREEASSKSTTGAQDVGSEGSDSSAQVNLSKKVSYPLTGLGSVPPRNIPAMDPEQFVVSLSSLPLALSFCECFECTPV